MASTLRFPEITPEYVAGVADSDGCFMISRRVRKHHQPTFSARFIISWKWSRRAVAILKAIRKKYEGCISYSITKAAVGKKIRMVSYSASDRRVDRILEVIGPFVRLKERQVKILRKLRASIKRHKKRPKPSRVIQQQENYRMKISRLNRE